MNALSGQRFLANQFRGCGVKKEVDRGWTMSLFSQEFSGLNVAQKRDWEDYFDKSATSSHTGHQNYTNVCTEDSYCLAYFHKCTGVVPI